MLFWGDLRTFYLASANADAEACDRRRAQKKESDRGNAVRERDGLL